jgi:hypothetical protein
MYRKLLIVLVFAIFVLGCTSQPKVNIEITPRYPCQGETVTFSFTSRNIDRIKVTDNEGNVLKDTTQSSGVISIANIREALLPITAKGWQGEESRTKRIPPAIPFSIIGMENATTADPIDVDDRILSSTEEIDTGETIGCNCTYTGSTETCEKWLPVVEVYYIYKGQRSEIPQNWFSSRVRVVKIKNPTNFVLSFFRNGDLIANLYPNEEIDIDPSLGIRPWGTWEAIYEPDNYHREFKGLLVLGKPCGGWLSVAPGTVRRNISVEFTLLCDL